VVIRKELQARKQIGVEKKNEVSHGIGSLATSSCNLVIEYMCLLENKTVSRCWHWVTID